MRNDIWATILGAGNNRCLRCCHVYLFGLNALYGWSMLFFSCLWCYHVIGPTLL